MKGKKILEKWKSKAMALLMAGVMAFAMAPLGTGVAFADEENTDEPQMDAKAVSVVCMYTRPIDLSRGSLTTTASDASGIYAALNIMNHAGVVDFLDKVQGEQFVDLNEDGLADISFIREEAAGDSPEKLTLKVADTCKVSDEPEKVISTENMESYLATSLQISGTFYYYNRLIFVFSKEWARNLGQLVIDMSKGPITLTGKDDEEVKAVDRTIDTMWDATVLIQKDHALSDEDNYYFDVDKNGTNDVVMTKIKKTSGNYSFAGFTFDKLSTSSIKGSKTIAFDTKTIEFLEDKGAPSMFYSSVKFFFGQTANTLTVKGKTTKIKAKTLKKKAKTYAISKFLTVSKAQGTVTYAKASGNKKIMISKDGKVTLKKKLKKGKYKVKVNVTAAGNEDYTKITKATTFFIKVK